LISVVMPAYNCAGFIQQALDSVLAQDYEPKEVIVVDDGSSDATPDVVRSYGGSVRLIRQANAGAAAARNTGVAAANGELIAFLDSDDSWRPGKLSAQAAYLAAHPDVGMVYCLWRVHEGNGPDPGAAGDDTTPRPSGWLYGRLLFSCVVHTSTVLLRRAIAQQAGKFDTSYRCGEDYDYWLRVSRLTQIHCIQQVLSVYRSWDGSITKRAHHVNYEYEVVRKILARFGTKSPDGSEVPARAVHQRLARACFDFGYQNMRYGDARLAASAFGQSVRHSPYRPKAWVFWAMASLRAARGHAQ
jgi:glycosyltransferase involved in cell wall biosynthesis